MDVNILLKALDNDANEQIINMSYKKIKEMTYNMLSELELEKDIFKDYLTKLKQYRYIDELNDLKIGAFIRWIPLADPENIHLTQGGIICDIKITDKGIALVCKNFAHKHYHLNPDELMIFQKLSGQEQVLLAALDYLEK
jgi:hypothetical protein